MKAKRKVLGGTFTPHITGSIGPIVSKKNRVHPRVDSQQPCEFHENWFKTATCIVLEIIITPVIADKRVECVEISFSVIEKKKNNFYL